MSEENYPQVGMQFMCSNYTMHTITKVDEQSGYLYFTDRHKKKSQDGCMMIKTFIKLATNNFIYIYDN